LDTAAQKLLNDVSQKIEGADSGEVIDTARKAVDRLRKAATSDRCRAACRHARELDRIVSELRQDPAICAAAVL
jgi:hypothetical protein